MRVVITTSKRCPQGILWAPHFRTDGACRCERQGDAASTEAASPLHEASRRDRLRIASIQPKPLCTPAYFPAACQMLSGGIAGGREEVDVGPGPVTLQRVVACGGQVAVLPGRPVQEPREARVVEFVIFDHGHSSSGTAWFADVLYSSPPDG